MPEGCGSWPAFWEVREDGWPTYGELDIVEGVNNISPNAATLHTSAGCTMPGGGASGFACFLPSHWTTADALPRQ
jgi:beta-glucanase (GH16 family)